MKTYLILGAVVALSSCQTGPQIMAYKAGTNTQQRQFEYDQCKIAALHNVPQNMATDFNPGYYNPGTVQCNTIGSSTYCNRVGAVSIPASATTYDANQNLRDREIARCMSAKGYQFLERPACPSEEERARAQYDPQPPSPDQVRCHGGVNMDS
jgi:hypothetical protein